MEAFVEGGGQLADRRLQFFLEEAAAQVEIHDRVVSAGAQALAEMCALFVERGIERCKHVLKTAGDRALADTQAFVEVTGTGNQRFIELARALIEGCIQLFGVGVERGGAGLELAEQLLAALGQRIAQLIEAGVEFAASPRPAAVRPDSSESVRLVSMVPMFCRAASDFSLRAAARVSISEAKASPDIAMREAMSSPA